MKENIAPIFASSAEEVLLSLCDCDINVDDIQNIKLYKTLDEINIILGISGQIRGQIIYGMSESFALSIASHMMELHITEADDLTISALSEIGNIITGNASTKLSDLGLLCETTIPKVIRGKDKNLKLYNNNVQLINVFTSMGTLSVSISIKD
ncbi:MAG: chemotaxis protein CheX [Candidatus Sericytochromatia bacterium]